MTTTIPHRDLRNRSSEILRRVQAGESYEITNHGEVVAVLVPPAGGPGRALPVRSATVSGGFAALAREHLEHPVQASLDELRGDR